MSTILLRLSIYEGNGIECDTVWYLDHALHALRCLSVLYTIALSVFDCPLWVSVSSSMKINSRNILCVKRTPQEVSVDVFYSRTAYLYSFTTISLMFFVLQENYTKQVMFLYVSCRYKESSLHKSTHCFDYWFKRKPLSIRLRQSHLSVSLSVWLSASHGCLYLVTIFWSAWNLHHSPHEKYAACTSLRLSVQDHSHKGRSKFLSFPPRGSVPIWLNLGG